MLRCTFGEQGEPTHTTQCRNRPHSHTALRFCGAELWGDDQARVWGPTGVDGIDDGASGLIRRAVIGLLPLPVRRFAFLDVHRVRDGCSATLMWDGANEKTDRWGRSVAHVKIGRRQTRPI